MARQALRITIVLGAIITLLGGTGIFAVFSDRATTGNDTVTSGPRPKAADLRIEQASYAAGDSSVNCDGDADGVLWDRDNLTTGLYTAHDIQPGGDLGTTYLCLKNVGSAALSLKASVIDLVDLDLDCTGDEAAAGDATCGLANNEPQAGELAPRLTAELERVVCDSPATPFANMNPVALPSYSAISFAGSSLASGAIACVRIDVAYPAPSNEADAQRAQSDSATWRFAFDGQASGTALPPPDAVTDLSATAGDGQVQLSWTAVDNTAIDTIEQASSIGGPFAPVDTVTAGSAGTAETRTIAGLTNGFTYYFIVRAASADGATSDSNVASATPIAP